jgi:hypothetical protein
MNAVVADEYEEGIFKVIRPTCVTDELPDAIVGVKKIVELSQLESGRHKRIGGRGNIRPAGYCQGEWSETVKRVAKNGLPWAWS